MQEESKRESSRSGIGAYAVALIALLLVVAACGSSAAPTSAPMSLTGEWERIESSFGTLDGMVVRVEGTLGVIVSTPDNEFQFQAGDVKWRNIETTSNNEYAFEDLVRESGTGDMSYVPGVITVGSDRMTLEMTFPTTGTSQDWRRKP